MLSANLLGKNNFLAWSLWTITRRWSSPTIIVSIYYFCLILLQLPLLHQPCFVLCHKIKLWLSSSRHSAMSHKIKLWLSSSRHSAMSHKGHHDCKTNNDIELLVTCLSILVVGQQEVRKLHNLGVCLHLSKQWCLVPWGNQTWLDWQEI